MSNKEGMPTQEEEGFMSCLLCGVKLKHDTGACPCVRGTMTFAKAIIETKKLFGEDSFTERDDQGRYYIGACPVVPGAYQGFMGYSWQDVVTDAAKSMEKVNGRLDQEG